MDSLRKRQVFSLLKGIETGDPTSVDVVNQEKYIQHNPQTREGGEGLAELFKRLSKTNPKVEIVRLFEDGDYVFGHTIYDFSSVRIGFEVFRFEGPQIVEHWDNIQPRIGDMVGGTVESSEVEDTETNRSLVESFMLQVAIQGDDSKYNFFVNTKTFVEHSTSFQLQEKLRQVSYQHTHRVLAERDFVLCVNEGHSEDGVHTSYYDLFRVAEGKIVEHWDTTEKVPPIEQWKNTNGKF